MGYQKAISIFNVDTFYFLVGDLLKTKNFKFSKIVFKQAHLCKLDAYEWNNNIFWIILWRIYRWTNKTDLLWLSSYYSLEYWTYCKLRFRALLVDTWIIFIFLTILELKVKIILVPWKSMKINFNRFQYLNLTIMIPQRIIIITRCIRRK